MKRRLLVLTLVMAPAAQAWPLWAEQQAIKFCEYRSIGIDTLTAVQAANRDLRTDYPWMGEVMGQAQDDGTFVKTTAAAIKDECPGEWQKGLKKN